MFIDQLWTLIFFSLLLLIQMYIKLNYTKLNLYFLVTNPMYRLIRTYLGFYFTYVSNYIIYTCTLTKWISTNYSDAYWALYSSKLNTNMSTLTFKK